MSSNVFQFGGAGGARNTTQSFGGGGGPPYHGDTEMKDITREEIDAKLEAVEARLETRLVSMDAKLDNIFAEVHRVGEVAREAKNAAASIKWNVLFTALGTIGVVVAVILAMWAIGYQIFDITRQMSSS